MPRGYFRAALFFFVKQAGREAKELKMAEIEMT
jgi:hypothetical protein